MKITINTYERDQALDLIAELLNRNLDLTIELDELDRHTARAQAFDQLHAPVKRVARDPLERPFVDARRKRATPVELNQRHDVKWAKFLEAQQAMTVACSKCGADIDQPCQSRGGTRYKGFAHTARIGDQVATRYNMNGVPS